MPGRTLRPHPYWYRLSAWQVRVLAALIGAASAFEVVFIGYLLLYELASPGKMILVTGLATGVISTILALTLISRARERHIRLVQWLRTVREMNHHTRNALEQINYSAYSTGDRAAIAAIRAGAGRIEWALREIMTQHGTFEAENKEDVEPGGARWGSGRRFAERAAAVLPQHT